MLLEASPDVFVAVETCRRPGILRIHIPKCSTIIYGSSVWQAVTRWAAGCDNKRERQDENTLHACHDIEKKAW